MRHHLINSACICETNTYWEDNSGLKKLNNIVRKWWKRKKIITSESIIKWPIVYKPGETRIVTSAPMSTRVTTSGEDNDELGWWSFMTIENNQDTKLSIITIYRSYNENSNHGVSKRITQQWDILEERGIEERNIRQKWYTTYRILLTPFRTKLIK